MRSFLAWQCMDCAALFPQKISTVEARSQQQQQQAERLSSHHFLPVYTGLSSTESTLVTSSPSILLRLDSFHSNRNRQKAVFSLSP